MKKLLALPIIAILLSSCSQNNPDKHSSNINMDSLKRQLGEIYKPGIGEFMMNIQAHHTKLWFAGKAENWTLADFEIEEIKEALADVQKFNSEDPESQTIPMIFPPLDSLSKAIENKNASGFKKGFAMLTNTCNTCHRATRHSFNVIIIPEDNPFPNQDFNVKGEDTAKHIHHHKG